MSALRECRLSASPSPSGEGPGEGGYIPSLLHRLRYSRSRGTSKRIETVPLRGRDSSAPYLKLIQENAKMATVKEHYDRVLSDVYSWMFGGFGSGIETNIGFFTKHKIRPVRSRVAIDLGAGCGFQSIALAKAGFSVMAVDINDTLLNELKRNSGSLTVTIVRDDLLNFDKYAKDKAELIVCMTDTLLHLETKDKALSLFKKVISSLEPDGKFIITFRDLSSELSELDRFIPVKSDENIIFTCFLEYKPETVKVHDIIYKKKNQKWDLSKSFYRKLRLSKDWGVSQLSGVGFNRVESTVDNGFVTVIATK